MHFDGRGVFFVHKRKPKICESISQVKGEDSQKVFLEKRRRFAKSIPWKKAKIRKKYSLREGRVLPKVFSVFSIMKKDSNCLSCLSGMEKRGFQVQNICIELKLHNNVRFDSWALRYPLATGNRSSGREELGPAFWGCRLISAPLRHGFCWSEQLQNQKTAPHTMSKYDHHVRWELNTKCKLVIIIYPGPTSKQPWLRDLKEARI